MRILSLLGSPRANRTAHSMARLIAGGLSGGRARGRDRPAGKAHPSLPGLPEL